MLLRLPWLLSRKRLLIDLLIDRALFAVLYLGWFRFNFQSWPEFSLPLTWLLEFWLVGSYVLGSYHPSQEGSFAMGISQVLRTLLVLVLSIGAYLIYHWLTATTLGAQDMRTFLLPFLGALCVTSAVVQFGLATLLQGRVSSLEQWLVLGADEVKAELRQQLAWSRLSPQLVTWHSPGSSEVGAPLPALCGPVNSSGRRRACALFPAAQRSSSCSVSGVEIAQHAGGCRAPRRPVGRPC